MDTATTTPCRQPPNPKIPKIVSVHVRSYLLSSSLIVRRAMRAVLLCTWHARCGGRHREYTTLTMIFRVVLSWFSVKTHTHTRTLLYDWISQSLYRVLWEHMLVLLSSPHTHTHRHILERIFIFTIQIYLYYPSAFWSILHRVAFIRELHGDSFKWNFIVLPLSNFSCVCNVFFFFTTFTKRVRWKVYKQSVCAAHKRKRNRESVFRGVVAAVLCFLC